MNYMFIFLFQYFYQINIRIIVVDVLQTQRSDLSLYSFEEFRNSR
uniref:Uncharacterized protein n=1 Tax=Ascaris lumbricoides TaxID=6252 RepID=A0A0M3HK04_ASCLU